MTRPPAHGRRVLVALVGLLTLGGAGCIEDRLVGRIPRCGDGVCESWDEVDPETPGTCPVDCLLRSCGNGACEPGELSTCPADCPGSTCGNGQCEEGEDPARCPGDCPWDVCGNHTCEEEAREGPVSCPEDCFPGLCGNSICEDHERPATCPDDCPATQNVDVLFVVDDSASMGPVQARVQQSVGGLLEALRSPDGQMVSLHLGVTSTDLGAGGYSITYCEEPQGDNGRLLGGARAGLGGVDYLVDVAPLGCDLHLTPNGRCEQPSCPADACDPAYAPNTELVVDGETGCPRCRNFSLPPDEAIPAMLDLGVQGCGFEQPLEAMARALTGAPGFLRPDAILLVVFVSDEDDCSAETPDLFDPSQSELTSPLGPLTSYRCFEFGVTCDVNQRTISGIREHCVPRTDPNRMLYTIDRYANLLLGEDGFGLDPGRVLVSVFAGPADEGAVSVSLDVRGWPEVAPACLDGTEIGPAPAIRLRALAARLHDADDLSRFAFHSLCDDDYDGAFRRLGAAIRERMGQ